MGLDFACHSGAGWQWDGQEALLSLSPLTDSSSDSTATISPDTLARVVVVLVISTIINLNQIICSPPPNSPMSFFTHRRGILQPKLVSLFYWQMVNKEKA